MIVPGLVSVTLRQCDIDEVVALAAECGLQAIHWGGDVHVPLGDHAAAERAQRRCAAEGIEVEAYGSYYRAGDTDPDSFTAVLDTALALRAPRVRVWAGRRGSADCSPEDRTSVVDDLRRCADAAAARGLRIAVEYHPDTLTDELRSAQVLLRAADHEALESYWQPRANHPVADAVHEVAQLRPDLVGVHVFAWGPGGYHDRLPLSDHQDLWRAAFAELARDQRERHALLEFVRDDSPDELREDAATLLSWLG
ncbi:sugar phosphate isomerase/epimerase family protein [Saccharopolyspora mangrovi]|uniref:TIM barrel protein n=1 Tax=Saccharopolyspora mangrovi TaxID=3082379 RepID=A0ABU6ABL6_9PSEU|nr:TIM barrel protein [Saccharopolyspora sp. S2-29]MEB3368934.1 TIM barrel protein [Saccharopolyspora sp. S2-29]